MAEPAGGFDGMLRTLRLKAGLTQEELAGAAGVSPRAISDLERGVVITLHKDTVRLLADALSLDGSVRVEFEAAARGRAMPAQAATQLAQATRTLPRDIASFTGRRYELRQLADAAAAAGGMVSIHAVGGMAGIGKTAFAVHAAHTLAGRFPGGQVFLPLHGHTPGRQPVSPADALASLLLTIGVPAGQIPADLEARTGLWRDRLAGRELLLVLDDAADSEQVRPLVPGSGGSMVLITSRRRLTALEDASTISLDILPAGEAAELLVRLAVRPGLSSADPGVQEIIRLCGFLPLAIGMVARQLYHHPTWTVADRAAELSAAVRRLEHLATERISVTAAFDLSYEDLPAEQQRLFRRLSLHPGSDIDAYATAALDDIPLTAARQGLEALYEHYLVAEPSPGRYRMHDLVAEHAGALTARLDTADDREYAAGRLLDYYQYVSARADAFLRDYTSIAPGSTVRVIPAAVPALGSGEQALAWLREERSNLVACLNQATAAGQHARVVGLTAALTSLLFRDGPWDEAINRHTTAAQAAEQTGDRLGRARALADRGELRHAAGDLLDAGRDLDEALHLSSDLGDQIGMMLALQRRGTLRSATGDFAGGADDLRPAIEIAERIRDPRTKAYTQLALAMQYRQTEEYAAAIQLLEEALAYYRDVGDRSGQAQCLYFLGDLRLVTGDHLAAEQELRDALDICRAIGHNLGQAETLRFLGDVQAERGDDEAASEYLQEALDIFQSIGNRRGEVTALGHLGRVYMRRGDHPAAARHLHRALMIVREIGDQLTELHVLNDCGTLSFTAGDLAEARSSHQQALAMARQIGSPRGEATALAGLARCARAEGRTAEAAEGLRQALVIFERSGAAESARVAAELEALTGEQGTAPASA